MSDSGLLTGLAPVIDAHSRVLVLGSFPGVASLQAQQYYGHPRNQFWPLMGALWGEPGLHQRPYADKLALARAHGLGLWDVYAECRREGSLDSAIREPRLNDLARLRDWAPGLRALVHNGAESAKTLRITGALGWPVLKLPSTSPAHASWSFDKKLAVWRDALAPFGLLD